VTRILLPFLLSRSTPNWGVDEVGVVARQTHVQRIRPRSRQRPTVSSRASRRCAGVPQYQIKQLVRGNQSTASLVPPNMPPAIAARPTFPNATARGPRKMINEQIASLKQKLSKVRQDKEPACPRGPKARPARAPAALCKVLERAAVQSDGQAPEEGIQRSDESAKKRTHVRRKKSTMRGRDVLSKSIRNS
jgi:hypothetical protein